MILDNIGNGLIIKNYKEMCLNLNEEEKKGSPRDRQIENWKLYFKFYKDKQKYIIEEVYDVPMKKDEIVLKGNHSIYIKYIETILLYLLSKQDNQTLVCTKNYLYVALGITGRNYIDTKIRSILVENKEFKQFEIDEFDGRAYQVLDRILFSALNSLQRRCLLNWYQELHISAIDNKTSKTISWTANEDEIRKFTAVKYDILKQMSIDEGKPEKYDSLRDIYFFNKTKDFYDVLSDRLYKKFGWKETCIKYRLIYKTENIIDAIPRTEMQLKKNLNNEKLELNSKVITALNNNAISHNGNLIIKFQDEYNYLCQINNQDPNDFPYDYKEIKAYLPPDNYIENQTKLAETLVGIKSGNVHPSKRINKKEQKV